MKRSLSLVLMLGLYACGSGIACGCFEPGLETGRYLFRNFLTDPVSQVYSSRITVLSGNKFVAEGAGKKASGDLLNAGGSVAFLNPAYSGTEPDSAGQQFNTRYFRQLTAVKQYNVRGDTLILFETALPGPGMVFIKE
ncbi:hypothetical protein [Siphonobacter aquaeclarae]|uniref:META domain-containing protein n=1 Tax=Siphonobacter aquaeclarae TaxID=563176 RepID=A0A1G9L5I4_9BACT|nr:hypothetical protein [Siphonobacter aquaeclarae]MBO9639220.1 hypothetical protein [Siphonobacter aquaeclarae]SDL56835.1 hypothetical protein SAMN04488090_1258 [Siphonobacter aquaeclarae]